MDQDREFEKLRQLVDDAHGEALANFAAPRDQIDALDDGSRLLRGSVGWELGKVAQAVREHDSEGLIEAVREQARAINDVARSIPDAATKLADSQAAAAANVRQGIDYNTDTVSDAIGRIGAPPSPDKAGNDGWIEHVYRELVEAIRSGGSFDEKTEVGAVLHAAGYPHMEAIAKAQRDPFRADVKKAKEATSSSVPLTVRHIDLFWEISRKIWPNRQASDDKAK